MVSQDLTQTKPWADSGGLTPESEWGTYLYVVGDRVVARVREDCANCAWNLHNHLYPGAEMALIIGEYGFASECSKVIARRKKERGDNPRWGKN